MAYQDSIKAGTGRIKIDISPIDEGWLSATFRPSRVVWLALLFVIGIAVVEVDGVIHLQHHIEMTKSCLLFQSHIEVGSGRSASHTIDKRLGFGRQIKPVFINHTATMTPIGQGLLPAVAAGTGPALRRNLLRGIQRAEILPVGVFYPDGNLWRILFLDAQEERVVVQPSVACLDTHTKVASPIFYMFLAARKRQNHTCNC